MESKWGEYYDAVSSRPPRDTLLKALALFDNGPLEHGFAIDLGCGSGIDTRELLRRGWRVLAIDREPEGIRRLLDGALSHYQPPTLETWVAPFEAITELPACDLINASFSLPFCTPEHFDALWHMIVSAIRPRGRFAGVLFGDRDGWAGDKSMTFHSRAQVESLLAPFKIEHLLEEARDGTTALGEAKFWHAFYIVARKVAQAKVLPGFK